eukprot:scaffold138249_cov151-Phaeocystis_antarctica.AAC.1
MLSRRASPSRSGRPAAPVGSASAHTTTSGHQHGASSSRTASRSACTLGCVAPPPSSPSLAAGTSTVPTVLLSPACGSSNARAWPTAPCRRSASSISNGEIAAAPCRMAGRCRPRWANAAPLSPPPSPSPLSSAAAPSSRRKSTPAYLAAHDLRKASR